MNKSALLWHLLTRRLARISTSRQGKCIQINETDSSPATEQLRDQVMESYGDRYRYISGGNASADDAAVATWMEGEGL